MISPGRARTLGGVPLWAVAGTAVPAGVLAVLLVSGPAAAVHRTPGAGASAAVPPAVSVSGGPSVRLTEGTGDGGGVTPSEPPAAIRHHLEFTGAFGWPDLAMGCFFDPDSRGADRYGRRTVCVETAVRPPVFGPTRIRGWEHRHGR